MYLFVFMVDACWISYSLVFQVRVTKYILIGTVLLIDCMYIFRQCYCNLIEFLVWMVNHVMTVSCTLLFDLFHWLEHLFRYLTHSVSIDYELYLPEYNSVQ
jgi:hypothetical protein